VERWGPGCHVGWPGGGRSPTTRGPRSRAG
jgi:hypothetical protein